MLLTQCVFLRSAPSVKVVRISKKKKKSAGKRQSCWTEASVVVRYTTKIANYVPSCSSSDVTAINVVPFLTDMLCEW